MKPGSISALSLQRSLAFQHESVSFRGPLIQARKTTALPDWLQQRNDGHATREGKQDNASDSNKAVTGPDYTGSTVDDPPSLERNMSRSIQKREPP